MVDSTGRRRAGVSHQQPQRRRSPRADGAAAAGQSADPRVRVHRGRSAVAAARAADAAEAVDPIAPLPLACACAATRLASRVLTGLYDEELRRAGVPAPQFALLSLLVKRPEASQRQLGAWLAMEQSTLSRNLQGVARRGWVSSHTEPGSRVAYYRVTSAGRALLRRARPAWQRAQARVQHGLGSDWEILAPLLHKIAALSAQG